MNKLVITHTDDGMFEMEQVDLPKSSAVYFIYNSNKELIYIGQTKNLLRRTVSHFQQDKWFQLFARWISYVDTCQDDLRKKEYELIQEFKPKFNFENYTGVTKEQMGELARSKPIL